MRSGDFANAVEADYQEVICNAHPLGIDLSPNTSHVQTDCVIPEKCQWAKQPFYRPAKGELIH